MRATLNVALLLFLLPIFALKVVSLELAETAQVMRQYDFNSGLSQVSVSAIAQDKFGYIWLGTQSGLNRFDGYDFRHFSSGYGSTDKLAGSFITSLCVSKQLLWVGTNTGLSVYHFDTAKITSFFSANQPLITSDKVHFLDCSEQGVLVSNYDGGYYFVSASDFLVTVPKGLTDQQYIKVLPWREGYLAIEQAELVLIKDAQRTSLLAGKFSNFKVQNNKAVLVDHQDQVHFFDLDTQQVIWSKAFNKSDNIKVNAINFEQDEILLATSLGVYLLDFTGAVIAHFINQEDNERSLKDNSTLSVMRDKAGDIWIGTESQGVFHYRYISKRFGHVYRFDGVDELKAKQDVRSFGYDHQNRLWVGTSHGLYIYDRGKFVHAYDVYKELILLKRGLITNLLFHDNQMWIATRGSGVVRFNLNTRDLKQFTPNFGNGPERKFNSILLYNEDLLFATRSQSILRYDAQTDALLPYFDERFKVPKHATSMLAADNALWFGSIGDGLFRFDGKKLAQLTVTQGLSSNLIFMLVKDQQNRVWAGSEHGITVVNDNFVVDRVISQRHGLSNDAVWGLLSDDEGAIWAGTSGGLSQINSTDFSIKNYSPSDGIQSNEFNYNAALKSPQGYIMIGGANGFNYFDPKTIEIAKRVTENSLNEIKVLGKSVIPQVAGLIEKVPELANNITLNHNQNMVSLIYSGFDFSSNHQLKFFYRVKGLQEQWIPLSKGAHQVDLIQLSPGKYVVETFTKNRFNQDSPIHQFSITINPPWWLSIKAKVLYFFSAFLVLFWVISSRIKRYRLVLQDNLAMHELKSRLELSLWASGDELWDWHVKENVIHRYSVDSRINYGEHSEKVDLDKLNVYVHPQDCALLKAKLTACLNGDIEQYEVAVRVKDNHQSWLWVLDRGKVVERDEHHNVVRIAGALKDIEELKTNQLELENLNELLEHKVEVRTEELSEQNQKLASTLLELEKTQEDLIESEKMASLGNLVAGVAHEINTPLGIALTAVTHNNDSLKSIDKQLADKTLSQASLVESICLQKEGYQLVMRSLERAKNLVSSFKQVAVDQSSEQLREINLKDYFAEIDPSFRSLLKGTAITVTLTCPDNLVVNTYPGALYQIVINLVQNSLLHGFEATQQGNIQIDITQEANKVVLTYRDNGCGMSEEIHNKVFEPFVTTKRNKGGSGLGMHIVFNLVHQALEGDIVSVYQANGGVCFKVTFEV